MLHEHNHDPYKIKGKVPEPTVCPVCHAVFRAGRWQWAESWPLAAHAETCEACRRIRDHYPAGEVVLKGEALPVRKAEILNLARNLERLETAEHPLHRIMEIDQHADNVVISTTDLHLARRMGEAIYHAFKGTLNWHYNKETCFVRVNWAS